MKFSILIPVYNVEKYIRECLDSVISQTFLDYEVILVDDGSEDRSGRICDEYALMYPEKIRVIHKQNQGLISARRVGISNASGDFCIFIDSDDSVEPILLEVIENYLSRDKEIDLLLYSYRCLRDGVQGERHPAFAEDGTIWCCNNKRQIYEKLIYTNEITSIWTKAIRTEILKKDPTQYERYYSKNMAEDLLQSLFPITVARKVSYTDRVLYNYRINTDSISHNYDLKRVAQNDTKHVYLEIKSNYLSKWGMDSEEYHKRLDAKWLHDVMYLFVRCYENTSVSGQRQKILTFDWNQLLPEMSIEGNNFVSNVYSRLYSDLKQKEYFKVKCYFAKKRFYRALRKIKRKIV